MKTIDDRIADAILRAQEARDKESAAQAAEDAKRRAIAEAEAKAAAEEAARWEALRSDVEAAEAEIAALKAQAEAERLQALRDAAETDPAALSLAERAADALAEFAGYDQIGLPIQLLGRVLLWQLTGVQVPDDLWIVTDPPAGFMARTTLGGTEFIVSRRDGAVSGLVGAVSLFAVAKDSSWRELHTLADLGRVLAEYGPVAQ